MPDGTLHHTAASAREHDVLHVATGLGVGGAQMMLVRFVEAARGQGCRFAVLSVLAQDTLGGRLREHDVAVSTLGMKQAGLDLRAMFRLGGRVRAGRPDLLHGWMYHGNLAASFGALSSLTFVPVIWSIHHTITDIAREKPMTRRLIRLSARMSRFTAAISYCSRAAADQHERAGFDPRRRHVIPNGTDCAGFRSTPARRARLRTMLSVPPERRLIGHFARYHPMKDQVRLVRAIGLLLREGHDVQLAIAGDGHADGPVRDAARELGIEERVSFLGLRDDVDELLPGLDVYALSSAWGEAFPLAVGEAMASEVPTVATDVGDASWLVGDTGVIVPPCQAEALAAGLAGLLALGDEERRALGAAARRRIIENFSLEQYVRRHLDLYREVLAPRHKTTDPLPRTAGLPVLDRKGG